MFVRIRALASPAALALVMTACAGGGHAPITTTPPSHPTQPPPADPFAATDRFTAAARTAFDRAAAMRVVSAADAGFRTRGNEAYRAALDAVRTRLIAAGFADGAGEDRAGAAGAYWEPLNNDAALWDARGGSIDVVSPAPERVLAFGPGDDGARTMLVAFGPPGEVTGELSDARAGAEVRGHIVLTEETAGAFARGPGRDALAVLSAHEESVNHPERHADLVRYDTVENVRRDGPLLLDVSRAAATRLRALLAQGRVVLHVRAEATVHRGRAETLVARVRGSVPEAAPIVLSAHADEPGANDNGSGLGTLAEVAALYARMVREGSAPPPRRTVVFLFGTEIESPERWMGLHPESRPAFALALDMTGEAPATAPMLIERMPDPPGRGAHSYDAHTEWFSPPAPHVPIGAHFLNAYAVSVMGRVSHDWPVRDHPFEGGSDHEPFLSAGVPAVLFWHFPDEAYHSNLDRLARVDAEEMARVGAGTLALVAHAASAGRTEALELVAIAERYAHDRIALEAGASGPAGAPAPGAVRAWGRWLADALGTVHAFPVAADPDVDAAIQAAQSRVLADAEARAGGT